MRYELPTLSEERKAEMFRRIKTRIIRQERQIWLLRVLGGILAGFGIAMWLRP